MAIIRKDRQATPKPLSDKGTSLAFRVGEKAHAKRGGLTPGMRKLMAVYNAKVAH
jgi:hypothetical protein